MRTFYRISGGERFLDRPLAEIGVPPFDIVMARRGGRAVGFELSGDAAAVLGPAVRSRGGRVGVGHRGAGMGIIRGQNDEPSGSPPAPAEGREEPPSRRHDSVSGGVDLLNLPRRDLAAAVAGRTGVFQVIVRQSALNRLYRHGHSHTSQEICGVLVGDVYTDATGPYLHVEAVIEGDHASGGAAQVTFTADTWTHVQGVMDRDYPQRRMVGWYHTHPGFGIFLSDMDLFLHGNFFNLPWQVAFVYDPLGGDEGLFVWQLGQTVRTAFLTEEDEPSTKPVVRRPKRRPPPPTERPAAGQVVSTLPVVKSEAPPTSGANPRRPHSARRALAKASAAVLACAGVAFVAGVATESLPLRKWLSSYHLLPRWKSPPPPVPPVQE